MNDIDMNDTRTRTNQDTQRDEEPRKIDVICFVKPKNSTKSTTIFDFMSLVSEKESIQKSFRYRPSRIPDPLALIEEARKNAGFRIFEHKVVIPLIVVRESTDFETIEYGSAIMDMTFGTIKSRPKMMTSVCMKSRILAILQNTDTTRICRREYTALFVGLKDLEAAILIPLQNTFMRNRERRRPQEGEGYIHEMSDKVARFKAHSTLVALRPYIHEFDPDKIFAVKTNIVIGNEGKITKNQVAVSKILWRGLFNNHPILMGPQILEEVFQVRSRTRPPPPPPPSRPHPSTAGKSIDPLSPRGGEIETIENDTYTNLLASIEARSVDIGRPVVDFLKTFLSGYVEVMEPFFFMYNLEHLIDHPTPEDVLLENLPTLLDHEECSTLRRHLEHLLPTIRDEVHVTLE